MQIANCHHAPQIKSSTQPNKLSLYKGYSTGDATEVDFGTNAGVDMARLLRASIMSLGIW